MVNVPVDNREPKSVKTQQNVIVTKKQHDKNKQITIPSAGQCW